MHLRILLILSLTAAFTQAEPDLRGALQQHCFKCHGEKKVKGKVNLVEAFAAKPHGLAGNPELMEKMIEVLRDGDMPPEDEQQPDASAREAWIAELEALVRKNAETRPLGRVPMRRMNRFEYNNAVVDLFELSRDAFALPERTIRDFSGYFKPASGRMPDAIKVGNRALGKSQFLDKGNTLPGVSAFPKDNRAEYGFDNRGDHLSLSPVLMESFFALSQSILNSPEFRKRCGKWKQLFAEPELPETERVAEGKRRLTALLRRAFRREVSESVAAPYLGRFEQRLAAGASFPDSMKAAVSEAMVSPRFLYRRAGAAQADGIDAEALAARLSFFLWSSIPDPALQELGTSGTLKQPAVLRAQAERMMDDARMKNFCDNFALQWLQLDQMIAALPDVGRYREYYFSGANQMVYRAGMHMMMEPLLLFDSVFIENRPVTDLIDPGYSYRSNLLTQWYRGKLGKIEVVQVNFRRVPLEDRRWGGIFSNAAVLTMTSAPLRTKPITRGAWLISTVFNDPPEPPPADVPEIEADDETLKQEKLTLRDKLKQHMVREDCAGCHRKIDPLGFALENYDPVGRWRDTYRNGLPVDSSGKLFNRHGFTGVAGFKDAILAEKDRFARALAGHLLSYALGRELDAGDRRSLDRIVENAAKEEYRFRSLIREVVLSRSFTHSANSAKVPGKP